jgi:transposase
MAHCRGEPRVVRIVQVPTPDQEDARRATRERDRLVKEQTAHTNRIKSLLRLLGMAVGHPRRRDWLRWLAAQRDWQDQAVPPQTMAELEREHVRLMLIGEQLAALEQPSAQAELTPAAAEMARQRDRLLKLKALGPALSGTFSHEVFYKDFRNHRQVSAYIGLTPSPWQSGNTDRDQGISKAGNPRARRAAIELAWLWVLHQPGSALTKWFKQRTTNASKRIRRIMIVALARKLMVALWRYLTTGLIPEGAVFKPVKA